MLWRAFVNAFGVRYASLAIWKVIWAILTWLGAYAILKWLIQYCERRDEQNGNIESSISAPIYQGHLLALALFLSSSIASICFHQLTIQCAKIGVQVGYCAYLKVVETLPSICFSAEHHLWYLFIESLSS
jgi:hypothetical protein